MYYRDIAVTQLLNRVAQNRPFICARKSLQCDDDFDYRSTRLLQRAGNLAVVLAFGSRAAANTYQLRSQMIEQPGSRRSDHAAANNMKVTGVQLVNDVHFYVCMLICTFKCAQPLHL